VNGTPLHQRAKSISSELESINFRLCQSIRREIQLAAGKEILLEWMLDWNDPSNFTNRCGYAHLE
jgi:hypothetical protein